MKTNPCLLASASIIFAATTFLACGYEMPAIETTNTEGGSGGIGGLGGSGGMVASSGKGGAGGSSSSAESSSSAMSSSSSSSSGEPLSVCGDGKLAADEQCDDHNLRNGDGCSDSCMTENHDGCDVPMLELAAEEVLIASTTDKATNTIGGTQGVEWCTAKLAEAPDVIYIVNPTINGTLSATLNATYVGHMLHIRTGCSNTMNPDIGCDDDWMPGNQDVSRVPVVAGMPVYVIVDGFAGNSGAFMLKLQLQ